MIGPVFGRLPSLSMEEANRTVIRDIFGRLDARAAWPRVSALVEAWRPDVVLRDPCEFGSLAAAERAGVAHAEVAIGIGNLQPWATSVLGEPLAELDEIVGLAPGIVRGGHGDGPGADVGAGELRWTWRAGVRRPVAHNDLRRSCAIGMRRAAVASALSLRRGAAATIRSST